MRFSSLGRYMRIFLYGEDDTPLLDLLGFATGKNDLRGRRSSTIMFSPLYKFPDLRHFYLLRSNAGLWIIIGRLLLLLFESSQGSLYRPEKH